MTARQKVSQKSQKHQKPTPTPAAAAADIISFDDPIPSIQPPQHTTQNVVNSGNVEQLSGRMQNVQIGQSVAPNASSDSTTNNDEWTNFQGLSQTQRQFSTSSTHDGKICIVYLFIFLLDDFVSFVC